LSESSADLEKNDLVQTNSEVEAGNTLDESSEVASDKMISHTISDRILMQLDQGKS
jgi:hypothetical protein